MLHFVACAVEIKSHDNNSIYKGDGAGPIVSVKTANFQGIGSNLKDALTEVAEKMIAFMQSDALAVGVEDKGRIATPSPFSKQ